uniref:Uncharacterized protein n=1 Tax=Odontella aurita TaxID=265563 RepID=A0A7S4HUN3_9STRA|mmetsp:Transcript_15321/g.44504  ORF Transcript_15321/g.44504 Transcript_15321/m.44504 type:complete len:508 (+) Transcript_15321:168-1691(+)
MQRTNDHPLRQSWSAAGPKIPEKRNDDYVQLEFDQNKPLGIKTKKRRETGDGPMVVTEFSGWGYAANVCREVRIDPKVFANAKIIGVNGRDVPTVGEAFLNERPISIMFRLHPDYNDLPSSRGVGVNRRHGNMVQLVFRESRSLGIQCSKSARHQKGIVEVIRIVRHSQGGEILKSCQLVEELFEGAKVVGVDGKVPKDAKAIYEAIKTPSRPKAILFEIVPPSENGAPAERTDRAASTRDVQRRASKSLLQSARFATESVRELEGDNDCEGLGDADQSEIKKGSFDRTRDLKHSLRELSGESFMRLANTIEEMEKMNTICEMKQMNAIAETEADNTENKVESDRRTSAHSNVSGGAKATPLISTARKVLGGFRRGPPGAGRNKRDPTSSSGSIDDSEHSVSVMDTEEFQMADEETQRQMLIKESCDACLKAISDHLELFLLETPYVTYEEWIEELHPENAQSRRNLVQGKSIDHRFYVEGSDHRSLWNENLGGIRSFVPVRDYMCA